MRWGPMLLILLSSPAASGTPETAPQPVPLTSVALVADIDAPSDAGDPGTGGGFDTGAFFQTRLTDARAIQTCMNPIERAAGTWAIDVGLSRGLRDRTATSLTLHYAKSGLPGLFTLKYQVEQGVKARARVDYVALDGTQRSPELARDLIDAYRIAALESALDMAIRCNGKAS